MCGHMACRLAWAISLQGNKSLGGSDVTILFSLALIVALCALIGAVLVARRMPPGTPSGKAPRHGRNEKPRG